MNLENLPDITLSVKRSTITSLSPEDFTIVDTLTISCDRLEFRLWGIPDPYGRSGYININNYKYEYRVYKTVFIYIYDAHIVDKFYDDLWNKLQERKNRWLPSYGGYGQDNIKEEVKIVREGDLTVVGR
jgi:hypothetical protein